jgi:hypothetical protein
MANDKHEQHAGDHPPAPTPTPTPRPSREAKAKAAAPDPKAAAELKEAQAAGSIGAQVILDFNSQAGLGARGGAAGTITENTMLRDENLVAIGLDPANPSGPPTGEPWEPPAVQAAAAAKHVTSKATRMSSLAAGIQDVPTPPPTDPPTVRGGAAA